MHILSLFLSRITNSVTQKRFDIIKYQMRMLDSSTRATGSWRSYFYPVLLRIAAVACQFTLLCMKAGRARQLHGVPCMFYLQSKGDHSSRVCRGTFVSPGWIADCFLVRCRYYICKLKVLVYDLGMGIVSMINTWTGVQL